MDKTNRPAGRARTYRDVRSSNVPEGAPTFNETNIPVRYMFDYLARILNLSSNEAGLRAK